MTGQALPADAELGPAEFDRIARIARDEAGLVLSASKIPMIRSRLVKRLRALGLADFGAYCALVAGGEGGAERARMISALTTNVSHFFREAHHFAILRDQVLPAALPRLRRGGRLRLWSAGCSHGQEPLSMAMTLAEALPDIARHDLRILATDIDDEVLAVARAGRYGPALSSGLDEDRRRRHFRPVPGGGEIEASAALRRLIVYRRLNLLDPWPMRGAFDVIFCRNVVIYFDDDVQRTLFDRFADALKPGGHIIIGHSENLQRVCGRFRNLGQTVYTKVK